MPPFAGGSRSGSEIGGESEANGVGESTAGDRVSPTGAVIAEEPVASETEEMDIGGHD